MVKRDGFPGLLRYLKQPTCYFLSAKRSVSRLGQSSIKERSIRRGFHESNKFIFVQDLQQALKILNHLCILDDSHADLQFRRVEVASKCGQLEQLFPQLQNTHAQSWAAHCAHILAEIRRADGTAWESQPDGDEPNPPDSSQWGLSHQPEVIGLGDLSGLSALSQKHPGLAQISKVLLPFSKNKIEQSSAAGKSQNNKVLRIHRLPAVADDAPLSPLPPQAPGFADLKSQVNAQNDPEQTLMESLALKGIELAQVRPDSFASWYVAGCAHELRGALPQAIAAWTKAIELEPHSPTVLSTMSELQQMGAVPDTDPTYTSLYEKCDKFLVHGSLESHRDLYTNFFNRGMYPQAIYALRSLADWMQRQGNHVPDEIEVMCLLGAMRVYQKENRHGAADACRREVENLVMGLRKSGANESQLSFLVNLCEEYGLSQLARGCLQTWVTKPNVSLTSLVQAASKLAAQYPSASSLEALRIAYAQHRGATEIKFCILVTTLALEKVHIERYLDMRNKAREFMQRSEIGEALTLLQELLQETQSDPDVHFYLAEIAMRMNDFERAKSHYHSWVERDPLNADALLRYSKLLHQMGDADMLSDLLKRVSQLDGLSILHEAEMHALNAFTQKSKGHVDEARQAIQAALAIQPWNQTYLFTQIELEIDFHGLRDHASFEPSAWQGALRSGKSLSEWELKQTLGVCQNLLSSGHGILAYAAAKALFVQYPTQYPVQVFFARSAAAVHSKHSVHELLLLLQTGKEQFVTFGDLAIVAARIYENCDDWALVDEWLTIAKKSKSQSSSSKFSILEMEASLLIFSTTQLGSALHLIEAAIESSSSKTQVQRLGILQGYAMVLKGELKKGLEKIEQNLGESPSLESLYVWHQALTRSENREQKRKDALERLYKLRPVTPREQKMLENTFVVTGHGGTHSDIHLIC